MAGQDTNQNLIQGTPWRQYLIQLRQTLETRFSEQELRTLCFDLGFDYENLSGDSKASRARELVVFFEHRECIPELVRSIQTLRADISLPDLPPPEAVERSDEGSAPLTATTMEPISSEGVAAAPARRKAPWWMFGVGAVVLLGLVGILLAVTGVLGLGVSPTPSAAPGTATALSPTPSAALAAATALSPAPSAVSKERPPTATRMSGEAGGVIVDNQDPGFAILAGDWLSCQNGDCNGICYGEDFRFSRPSCLSCRARFNLLVPAAGEYDVWAWWPKGGDRSIDTPFTIDARDGPAVVEVDQRHNGDQWYLVATLHFDAQPTSVEVSGSDEGYANADAVALTPAGSGPP